MTCVDLLFNPQVVWFERQQIPHSDDNRMEDGILIPVIWVRSDDDAGGWIEIADHITAAATRWQQEVFTLRAAPYSCHGNQVAVAGSHHHTNGSYFSADVSITAGCFKVDGREDLSASGKYSCSHFLNTFQIKSIGGSDSHDQQFGIFFAEWLKLHGHLLGRLLAPIDRLPSPRSGKGNLAFIVVNY